MEKGAYVLFCPPQLGVFDDAKERGYIGARQVGAGRGRGDGDRGRASRGAIGRLPGVREQPLHGASRGHAGGGTAFGRGGMAERSTCAFRRRCRQRLLRGHDHHARIGDQQQRQQAEQQHEREFEGRDAALAPRAAEVVGGDAHAAPPGI